MIRVSKISRQFEDINSYMLTNGKFLWNGMHTPVILPTKYSWNGSIKIYEHIDWYDEGSQVSINKPSFLPAVLFFIIFSYCSYYSWFRHYVEVFLVMYLTPVSKFTLKKIPEKIYSSRYKEIQDDLWRIKKENEKDFKIS